jgi:hypothetical protein
VANPYRDKYGRFSTRANAVQTLGRITVNTSRAARGRYVARTAGMAGANQAVLAGAVAGAVVVAAGAVGTAAGARRATVASRGGVREYRHSGGARAVMVRPGSDRSRTWWVADIRTPRAKRGQGQATQLGRQIMSDADRKRMTLRGVPLAHGSGRRLSQSQLQGFYARRGGVAAGPSSRFGAAGQMRRVPQPRARATRTPAVRVGSRRRR